MYFDQPIQWLVLDEFRLADVGNTDAVAQLVGASGPERELRIPLLTSVHDRRNVAAVRGVRAGDDTEADRELHEALDRFVSNWETPKRYGPRVTEHSVGVPVCYRLAVTDMGNNDPVADSGMPRPSAQPPALNDVALVWIGARVGTDTGVMVLIGGGDDANGLCSDAPVSALSSDLPVRIYESRRH